MAAENTHPISPSEAFKVLEDLFSTINSHSHHTLDLLIIQVNTKTKLDNESDLPRFLAYVSQCDITNQKPLEGGPSHLRKFGEVVWGRGDTIEEAVASLFYEEDETVPGVGKNWALRVFHTKKALKSGARPLRVVQFNYANRTWVDLPIDEWW